jgi:hypothetical protein
MDIVMNTTPIYVVTLLAGTAYLVDQRGWSAWWFLLTFFVILCMMEVWSKMK